MDLHPVNWFQFIPAAAGGGLITLAALNVALAIRRQGPASKGHLAFAVIAVSAAATGIFEVLLMNARTIDQYGSLLRAVHIPITLLVVTIPWFVRSLFGAGRLWMAVLGNALWIAAVAISVSEPHSRVYDPITAIGRSTLPGGAEFTWVTGSPHPGRWIGYAGVFVTLLFVLDAAVSLWRRRDLRRAANVGGYLGASLAIALFGSMLIDTGLVRMPYFISAAFVIVMGGMAFELVHDAMRTPMLEHRVEVREAEVAHLSRRAMLPELAGGVAHELSQPLTAILNNAEAGLSFLGRDEPDLDEVREALKEIAEQDRHASDVIAGFVRLLRERGRQAELLSPNELVEEVIGLARGELARQGIGVETEMAPSLPAVRGDRVLLCSILLNLVRNSAEAVAELDGARRRIAVRTQTSDGGVVITIDDHGPGIPEADLERVFDPFFTTRPEGSGLGLAVSRTLAEMHGGTVWASRDAGEEGTSMHVFLPAAESQST